MDLELLYAEKTDDPHDIKANNSATSTYEDNIQRESCRALSRSPWKSWNFKKVAHVVWFVALFVPSFVYSYGQWPRTPVGYISKLMDIASKVLIVALSVWTLFYNANWRVRMCTLSLYRPTVSHTVLPVAPAAPAASSLQPYNWG